MANRDFTAPAFAGRIPPSTLRRMFGTTLPSSLNNQRDSHGYVPSDAVFSHLQTIGLQALQELEASSEIVVPGSPEALTEF